MHLSAWDYLLWAAGFTWNIVLVFVLFYRERARSVPWFTAWIAFDCFNMVALFLIYRHGSPHSYFLVYWGGAFADLLLQVATVLEIAHTIFTWRGHWVAGAKQRFLALAASAPIAGLTFALLITPAAETKLDAWDARANLFITVLICLLFSAVLTVSRQFGLGWRNRVMRASYGLVVWSLVSFATDTLHSYWRTLGHFTALEHLRMAVFQLVSIYWTVIFWLPEPEPENMPENVLLDLQRLQSRLKYGQLQSPPKGGAPRT